LLGKDSLHFEQLNKKKQKATCTYEELVVEETDWLDRTPLASRQLVHKTENKD